MDHEWQTLLNNARVRLQSYHSGRFCYGWSFDAHGRKFKVFFASSIDKAAVGERFHIEANDSSRMLMADATLVAVKGSTGSFELISAVREAPPCESRRILVEIEASLSFGQDKHDALIVDISDNGMGILTSAELEKKAYVTIGATLVRKDYILVGKVVYCRERPQGRWLYRSGLYIPGLNSLIDPLDGDIDIALLP